MEAVGRINNYVCTKCSRLLVTINLNTGVTHFGAVCPSCKHLGFSTLYETPGPQVVTHCWYRPDKEEFENLGPEVRDHVNSGGLLLRPLEDAVTEEITFKALQKYLKNIY